jgi:hypothetical protein
MAVNSINDQEKNSKQLFHYFAHISRSTKTLSMASQSHPDFDELPLDKKGPRGNAWGRWGPDDQLGTLNHLNDQVVSQAARENIKIGSRLSLK